MTLKHDIMVFLLTNPNVQKLNFQFLRYKISSKEYSDALYSALQTDEIIIRTKGATGPAAGASYDHSYDSFELKPNFSISNWRDQGFFIHESTHAVLDMKNIGPHSGHEDEAVAYLAEAIFLESAKKSPLGDQSIRLISQSIAKGLLASHQKKVSDADAKKLVREVAKHPMYQSSTLYNSNRFNRSLIHRILR